MSARIAAVALAISLFAPAHLLAKPAPTTKAPSKAATAASAACTAAAKVAPCPATWPLPAAVKAGGAASYTPRGPGFGGLRCAKPVTIKKGSKVYRLFGSPGKAGPWGAYWTARDFPPSPTTRKAMAVCNVWNDFKFKIVCTAKQDIPITGGLSESVLDVIPNKPEDGCKKKGECFPATSDIQLFWLGAQAAKQQVADCKCFAKGSTAPIACRP